MKHNFGAGPCILPQEVFKQASEAVIDFNGLSILEISHRSPDFVQVMEEARENVKRALNVPKGYTVLYLQGGASLGFLISAMNLAGKYKRAGYINTGAWATKAIKEAKNAGLEVVEVASSADKNFSYIPEFDIPSNIDFLHYTSNNTISGTQFKSIPETDVPLVCDMSSDIFSKEVDISKFDLIYAGAQKNLGPAGATLYIVKDSVLGNSSLDNIPTYLDLQTHAKKDSMFNTPPVFSVFVANLNLKHLLKNGGVPAKQKENEEKAALLYEEIDRNPNFEGTTKEKDRSLMNVTFRLTDESKKEAFDKLWNDANIVGLKGHRSVGGYRASMYNALTLDSVKVLVEVLQSLK